MYRSVFGPAQCHQRKNLLKLCQLCVVINWSSVFEISNYLNSTILHCYLKVTLSTKYSAPISVGLWSPQKIQFLYKFYVLNILVVYLHFAHALSYSLRSRGKLEDCKTRMYNSIKSVLKQFERVFTEYDYPSLFTTSCSISIFYQIPPGCLKKSLFIHDNCDLYFLILTIFFGWIS